MLALIQSYPGGNETLKRHWPFFLKSGATEIWVIGTVNGDCWAPEDVPLVKIGEDRYIDGAHLPNRLLDTLEAGLKTPHQHLMVCEYDVLFFNPIRYNAMEHAVAAPLSGGPTWGSRAKAFHHNPWLFHREFAKRFIDEGRVVVAEGISDRQRGLPPPAEASPDVFFGLVCQQLNQTVQTDLWTEFSQNSFDIPGTLDLARYARIKGVDVIHGCKTEKELNEILRN